MSYDPLAAVHAHGFCAARGLGVQQFPPLFCPRDFPLAGLGIVGNSDMC